jgi:hypothetical protein
VAPNTPTHAVLPLSFTAGAVSPGAVIVTLQMAIKNRQQPVWYFADNVPLPELFLPTGSLERDTYLQVREILPRPVDLGYRGISGAVALGYRFTVYKRTLPPASSWGW